MRCLIDDWRNGGFGLYIHWPFCEAKCPYCDFNSHVSREIDEDRWKAAYLREIDRIAALTPERVLNSVFFGGGTPSLMSPELVNEIIERVRSKWRFANNIEITLEANPRSVEAGRFQGFSDAGVNRVSMGIQALNNHDLAKLGRLHSVEEAKKAFDTARTVFDRISFDLIYARQGQSLPEWRNELNEALEMSVDHLSMYQLTVEQGTAFWERQKRGQLKDLPNEDLAADMYELTQEVCEKHGMPAYEVSNHAKPGAESQHNLIYWRYGDYAGIGPGAHGRLTQDGVKYATAAWRNPGAWLEQSEQGSGDRTNDVVPRDEQAVEYILMGLRISEGIDIGRARDLDPTALPQTKLTEMVDLGLIEHDQHTVQATPQGRMVLNSLIAELLPDHT